MSLRAIGRLCVGICVASSVGGRGVARADSEAPPSAPVSLEVDSCPAPTGSDGDRTSSAADHYDRGVVFYENGNYHAAAKEFIAGYCDKPHPSMFYNIAQSFERTLDYEKAVAYFEKFVAAASPNDSNRRKAILRRDVLMSTPAQIRVASEPPSAHVKIVGSAGVVARGTANSGEAILVRRGKYQLTVEKNGYEAEVRDIDVAIGQPYSFTLVLRVQTGTLQVNTLPRRARILIDGALVALGSHTAKLPIGKHLVTAELENRESVERTVEILPGRASSLTLQLAEPPISGHWELVAGAGVGMALTVQSALQTTVERKSGSLLTTAGLAVGLGVGVAGTYLGVPKNIPVGHTSYIMGTAAITAAEGYLVWHYLTCGDKVDTGAECSSRNSQAFAVVTGLAGATTAALTVSQLRPSAGDVALVNSATLWGAVSGAFFAEIFDAEVAYYDPLVLAGLNVGLASGLVLAKRYDISRRRSAIIDLGGISGVLVGLSLAAATDTPDETGLHYSLLGMATGLGAATFWTRFLDDDVAPKTSSKAALNATVQPSQGGFTLGVSGDF